MLEQLPKKYQIPRNLSLYMIHVHSVYTVTLGKCITTKSLCPILNHFNIREKVKICKELDRKIRQIVGEKIRELENSPAKSHCQSELVQGNNCPPHPPCGLQSYKTHIF